MRPVRTAPLKVRQLDQRTLHAIAGKLMRESRTKDLTERQGWFLDQVFAELRWRHDRYELAGLRRPCCCELCLPPWLPGEDTPDPTLRRPPSPDPAPGAS